MNRKKVVWILISLMWFVSCKERELDMTVEKETWYQGYDIHEVQADDAWNLTIVQDDGPSYVELEYSAFLFEYIHIEYENDAFRFYLGSHSRLPYNTVLNATIHTDELRGLTLNDAASAVLDGDFAGASLKVELNDASTCKGGSFTGVTELLLNDACQMVDFSCDGTTCSIVLDDASVFKGTLTASESLDFKVTDASRLTTYGGSAPMASVEVGDAGSLNMLETEVQRMQVTLNDAAEAYVNVLQSIQGSLRDGSKLFYQLHPGLELDVECDESSHLSPLHSKF